MWQILSCIHYMHVHEYMEADIANVSCALYFDMYISCSNYMYICTRMLPSCWSHLTRCLLIFCSPGAIRFLIMPLFGTGGAVCACTHTHVIAYDDYAHVLHVRQCSIYIHSKDTCTCISAPTHMQSYIIMCIHVCVYFTTKSLQY